MLINNIQNRNLMRTKILLLLLAFACCNIIASNTDLRSAERDFEKVQKEISQLASQKMATETKLQKAEADLEEATANMEETKDKPKSLPYKNAVKKAEKSQKKIEELRSSLLSIEEDIESKSAELLNCQQILLSAQQAQEDDAAAKKQAKEDAKLAKQRQKDSIKLAKQQAKEERVAKQQGKDNLYQKEASSIYKEIHKNNSEKESVTTSKESNNKEPIELSFWEWMVFIGICVVAVWILWIKFKSRYRCPKCGKWFKYENRGVKVLHRGRTANEMNTFKYERTLQCSCCNHKYYIRGTYATTASHLPEEWY